MFACVALVFGVLAFSFFKSPVATFVFAIALVAAVVIYPHPLSNHSFPPNEYKTPPSTHEKEYSPQPEPAPYSPSPSPSPSPYSHEEIISNPSPHDGHYPIEDVAPTNEPAQAPDSPLSQLSHVTSDIISNNQDHDSEAETDIASTNNTPVKTRTRPGLHYSLDSDPALPGRSPEKSSFLSQATAALARKRKAG